MIFQKWISLLWFLWNFGIVRYFYFSTLQMIFKSLNAPKLPETHWSFFIWTYLFALLAVSKQLAKNCVMNCRNRLLFSQFSAWFRDAENHIHLCIPKTSGVIVLSLRNLWKVQDEFQWRHSLFFRSICSQKHASPKSQHKASIWTEIPVLLRRLHYRPVTMVLLLTVTRKTEEIG